MSSFKHISDYIKSCLKGQFTYVLLALAPTVATGTEADVCVDCERSGCGKTQHVS